MEVYVQAADSEGDTIDFMLSERADIVEVYRLTAHSRSYLVQN